MTVALSTILDGYVLEMTTSVICGISCGLIGCFVVLRRMALIGDALSHAILPGVVVAFMLVGTGPWALFAGAMLAGLLTSLVIGFVQHNSRIKEDSSIGLAFTFFFAVGVILISQLPEGTHFDLQCFLFGDPLAAQTSDLWMMLAVGVLVSLTIIVFYRPLFVSSFDPVMAVCLGISVTAIHYLVMALLSATVVASLQAVGVIMVIAMLIAPGATAYQLTDRLPVMLAISAIVGGASAFAGFVLAFWRNWPTGPAMTIVAGGLFTIAMLLSPKYGFLFTRLRRYRARRHILIEDVLKSADRLHPEPLAVDSLSGHLGLSRRAVARLLGDLERGRWLDVGPDGIRLTERGKGRADEILRSHRLWEKYLAGRGVPPEQVHDLAEVYEHAHDLADNLDRDLGSPATDPHGQRIPRSAHGRESS